MASPILYYGGDSGKVRKWTASVGWTSMDVPTMSTFRIYSLWGSADNFLFAGTSHLGVPGSPPIPEIWFWNGSIWTKENVPAVIAQINQSVQIHGKDDNVFASVYRNANTLIELHQRTGSGNWTQIAITGSQKNVRNDLYVVSGGEVYISSASASGRPGLWRWIGGSLQQELGTVGLPNSGVYSSVFEWKNQLHIVRNGSGVAPAELWKGSFNGGWAKVADIGSINGYLPSTTYYQDRGQQWGFDADNNLYLLADGYLADPRTVLKLAPSGEWSYDTAVGGSSLNALGSGGSPSFFVAGNRYFLSSVGSWQTDAAGVGNPSGSFALFEDIPVNGEITLGDSETGRVGGGRGFFVIARDVIKLNFTSSVAVTESLRNPSSYSISPDNIAVEKVLPIYGRTTDEIFLKLSPNATFGASYQLTIPSAGTEEFINPAQLPDGTLFSPSGEPLATMEAEWVHHRTKVDSVLSSLAGMYDKSVESNIRSILQAIMVSDEEIGGDF